MAKGLRSSVKKSNRTKLRARVFQPVESARAERIHAKLLEIVRQPKPEAPKKAEMEVDSVEEDTTAGAGEPKEGFPKEMDVDAGAAPAASTSGSRKRSQDKKKRKNVKPRNAITFPKSRGKGALKPFSESRIRKRK